MKKTILLLLVATSFNVFALRAENPADHVIKALKVLSVQDLGCSHDYQCDVVAVGTKACGGPADFVMVSSQNNKYSQIEQLALLSKVLDRDYNVENGIISDCAMQIRPVSLCVQNKCVISK